MLPCTVIHETVTYQRTPTPDPSPLWYTSPVQNGMKQTNTNSKIMHTASELAKNMI